MKKPTIALLIATVFIALGTMMHISCDRQAQAKPTEAQETTEAAETTEATEATVPNPPAQSTRPAPAMDFEIKCTHPNDKSHIEQLLKEGRQLGEGTNVPLHFARHFLGYPYVAYTLDQDLSESLVINTEGLDCTTFVENVLALTICTQKGTTSFDDFCRTLAMVRYIGSKVSYPTRQHYFTIWLTDNISEGLVADVELPASPMSAKRKPHVDYMTQHVSSYKMLNAHKEWLPDIKKMEAKVNATEFTYIPKAQLKTSNRYRKYIHDGDIIGIVTDKAGLDISHVGFAIWHDDGLHLFNASSLHKKVVDEPMTLYEYLQRQTKSAGIRVARIL